MMGKEGGEGYTARLKGEGKNMFDCTNMVFIKCVLLIYLQTHKRGWYQKDETEWLSITFRS